MQRFAERQWPTCHDGACHNKTDPHRRCRLEGAVHDCAAVHDQAQCSRHDRLPGKHAHVAQPSSGRKGARRAQALAHTHARDEQRAQQRTKHAASNLQDGAGEQAQGRSCVAWQCVLVGQVGGMPAPGIPSNDSSLLFYSIGSEALFHIV
jgi:hypothetical protein